MRKVLFSGSSSRNLVGLLVSFIALSGCAGRMICEWESQDERFEKLAEKVVEEVLSDEEKTQDSEEER